MAAIPARARSAERALLGAAWDSASIESAARALADDFLPLTDLRASSGYRQRAAANLLRRFYLEYEGAGPVRTAAALAAWP
jgi:xanthine dehydrogenase small subunit